VSVSRYTFLAITRTGSKAGAPNVFSQFITLLQAEKSGLGISGGGRGVEELEKLASDLTKKFEQ
jgi:hypothetical protein